MGADIVVPDAQQRTTKGWGRSRGRTRLIGRRACRASRDCWLSTYHLGRRAFGVRVRCGREGERCAVSSWPCRCGEESKGVVEVEICCGARLYCRDDDCDFLMVLRFAEAFGFQR